MTRKVFIIFPAQQVIEPFPAISTFGGDSRCKRLTGQEQKMYIRAVANGLSCGLEG
jgi:hypothetical protein